MQNTWSDSTDSWTSTTHIWANQTYQDSASLDNTLSVTKVGNAILPSTASISQLFLTELHEEDLQSPISAILGNVVGVSAEATLVLPVDASLNTDTGFSSSNTYKAVGSVTFDNDLDVSNTALVKFVSAAVLNQALSDVNEEDAYLLSSAILSGNYGIIVDSILVMPSSANLALSSDTVNNVNYPHEGILRPKYGLSATNRLLWVDETDSSDSWTEQTESSDTWTTITEDNTTWTND